MKKFSILFAVVVITTMLVSFGVAGQVQAEPNLILVYFDGHMHSVRSDGNGTVADIKSTALSRGLDAVIVTDHCEMLTQEEWDSLVADTAAASDENFLAFPGFEITGSEGLFNRDHILAINVDDPFADRFGPELCPSEVWFSPFNPAGTGALSVENIAKWVDFIHAQGGIAVHNHPSGTTQLDYGVKLMEVYNQGHVDDVMAYAMLLGYSAEEAWELGFTFNNFALYGERDVNMPVPFPGFGVIPLRIALYQATLMLTGTGQWLGSPEAPLSSWDDLLMAYVDGTVDEPIFALANTDAHNTGDPDSSVGLAKNGVYLMREFSEREFFKALKAGRSFATTGPSLAFSVNGELMGDTATITDGQASIHLSVNPENPAAVIYQIKIIKNGEDWLTISPYSTSFEDVISDELILEDGYYRVEVITFDWQFGDYGFAWSNPVFVDVE